MINILTPVHVTYNKKNKIHLLFDKNPLHSLKLLRATLEVINQHYEKFFYHVTLYNWFSLFRSTIHLDYVDFIKQAKYFTAYPYAKTLSQEIEVAPSQNPWLFTGKIRSMLIKRTLSPHHKQVHFWWSWLQGIKRGCEQAEKSFIDLSYKKHQQALGKPTTFVPTISHIEKSFNFSSGLDSYDSSHPVLLQVSGGATFEKSRGDGGGLSYILENQLLNHEDGIPSVFKHELLIAYEWKGKVTYVYGIPIPTIDKIAGLAQTYNHKRVKVQAILEPLKVRMVTKGNSYAYAFSRFYQKVLWKHLVQFEQFKIIGEPLREEHLYNLIEREKISGLNDLTHFVSGDYSAATDNLSINVTKLIFESFLHRSALDECKKDILRNVLYEQSIRYPDGTKVEQRNGQLMGSTLSFPILCLANLLCYWISIEKYTNRSFNFQELPVLINGDDILFRSNSEHYEIWKQEIASVGFQLSIGKNYIHSKYLTINSQLFSYNGTEFREIRYYNTGLLTGQSKLGAYDKLVNLRVAYDKVLAGSNNKLLAHNKFIYYNLDMIKEHKYINMFIPESLGGLGCYLYPEVRPHVHITNYQRCVAKSSFTYDGSFGFISKAESSNRMLNKESTYEFKTKEPLIGPLLKYHRRMKRSNSSQTLQNSNFCLMEDMKFKMIPRKHVDKHAPIKWSDDELYGYSLVDGYIYAKIKDSIEYKYPDILC